VVDATLLHLPVVVADVSQIYAERDVAPAVEVVQQTGQRRTGMRSFSLAKATD
jgi:hypothetical protein